MENHISSHDAGEPVPSHVDWGAPTSLESFNRHPESHHAHLAGSKKSFATTSAENIVEISQWPYIDPFEPNNKQSPLNLSQPGSYLKCFGIREKKPLDGVMSGPTVNIDTSVLLTEYFSMYEGQIDPKSTALVSLDGATVYTYEELNILTDQMAKLLKPTIEEELSSKLMDESNQETEYCIGIAIGRSEKWVILILAVLKLGLPFLPIRIDENPIRRLSKTIEALKPIVIIGSNSDSILTKAARERCLVVEFQKLWEMSQNEKDLRRGKAWNRVERGQQLTIKKLHKSFTSEDRSKLAAVILYRFNGKGEIVTTVVRNATVWNRIHAEWKHFPYSKNEVVALTSSVDSNDFLGQMMAPLLGGTPIVPMNLTDVYSFAKDVAKWKIERLTLYPKLLRAIIYLLQLIDDKSPDAKLFNSVKYWFCTGGSLRRDLAMSFFRSKHLKGKLINLYGCKEALSFVCFEKFKSLNEVKYGLYFDVLPVGRPVINTKIYILDEDQQIKESFGLGEVYIAGLGITDSTEKNKSKSSSEKQNIQDGTTDKQKKILNPNLTEQDHPMYRVLLRTSDIGRLIYSDANRQKIYRCFLPDKVTLQFVEKEAGEATVENYHINTNEILFHIKCLPTVKTCHVMIYRPGTRSMAILAFIVVSHRQQLTKEELHDHLKERLPRYMMPTIIFIPGLPIKDFKINKSHLVKLYQQEMMNDHNLKDYGQLELTGLDMDSSEVKASIFVLCRVLFYCCDIREQWIYSHLNWTLAELSVPFTALPSILKELRRHGYCIEMKDFFCLKTPKEIIHSMVKNVDDDNIRTLPTHNGTCGQFVVENVTEKHRDEILKLFVNTSQYSGSIFYFGGMKKGQVRKTLADLWPLIALKSYSIAVRNKSTKEIVAALLNADYSDKCESKEWIATSKQPPYKYYLELLDEIDEMMEINGLISSSILKTLFFIVDRQLEFNFKASIQVIKLLIIRAMEVAQAANFHAMYIPIFDYVYSNMLVEGFDFDIIDSKQINSFEAKDRASPFGFAPDNISGIVLHKVL